MTFTMHIFSVYMPIATVHSLTDFPFQQMNKYSIFLSQQSQFCNYHKLEMKEEECCI